MSYTQQISGDTVPAEVNAGNHISGSTVSGEMTRRDGEEYYKIQNVDHMPAFFISLVSDQDHWLFAGSQGGVTAGRVSPETSLFPYQCVDKIYDTASTSGAKTVIRCKKGNESALWEPFNLELDGIYDIERNLYKNALGNKLCFEEVNHNLGLTFSYEWQFSDAFGIVRKSSITYHDSEHVELDIVDGLINILPAGAPRFTQTVSSNLVDAYKFNEVNQKNGLALYSLYSAITDRAEPAEALRATTVASVGLDSPSILLNASDLRAFKLDRPLSSSPHSRGVRGAYLINHKIDLSLGEAKSWYIFANIEQDQTQIGHLNERLKNADSLYEALEADVTAGSVNLRRIMGVADGHQLTAEREVSLHHYANTLFNVLRGGYFANQYQINTGDLKYTIGHFNKPLLQHVSHWFDGLEPFMEVTELKRKAFDSGNKQLIRLVNEYLPITFGRRHGDPSRPWNQFAIELKDDLGQPLLSYQGNWRDIFQNWEALTLSYPNFIGSVIAKFVNASTMDGYNPYRITKQGIDWEVEEPDDPWSYIGYWGDHQIIYLQKLLEVSDKFLPDELADVLMQPIYAYANVPYRIRDFDSLCLNPKETVDYDQALADKIEQLEQHLGADAKLVLDANNEVYQVNLLEKLVVTLLTKLSNMVVDGGIWLNTQRPEWNDANNALVGQGLSMVTLYYMNRYVAFLQKLLERLAKNTNTTEMTSEVADWFNATSIALTQTQSALTDKKVSSSLQLDYLKKAGSAASQYRGKVYQHDGNFSLSSVEITALQTMLQAARDLIWHSIQHNQTPSGMYHAYNILHISKDELRVTHLYEMLEGQVAALSSGALSYEQAEHILAALFKSDIYREDIGTFMLYPDREQQGFMHKNIISDGSLRSEPLIAEMLAQNDYRLVQADNEALRFASSIFNAKEIENMWPDIKADYANLATDEIKSTLLNTYEVVFKHAEFTGRSGGMFGFEGLGCVYWHMVAKLLLAAQEVAIDAHRNNAPETDSLIGYYYRVREGIGFNKQPEEYGAFPTDPYSHTPKHAGAQQPGMTGQVKEELIARFGELGCVVENGQIRFEPILLRKREFVGGAAEFHFIDLHEEADMIVTPAHSLAFTWCQIPIIYVLDDSDEISITVKFAEGDTKTFNSSSLCQNISEKIFNRNGDITSLLVNIPASNICAVD